MKNDKIVWNKKGSVNDINSWNYVRLLVEIEHENKGVTKTWNYVTAFRKPAFCWP
jgi:hypothetical protein